CMCISAHIAPDCQYAFRSRAVRRSDPSLFFLPMRPRSRSTLFPYTTLFRSVCGADVVVEFGVFGHGLLVGLVSARDHREIGADRSEEHTSELQSRGHLVCRLLLEKKKVNPETEIVCDRQKSLVAAQQWSETC